MRQRSERCGARRRDRVEDAEKGFRMSAVIAADQGREVEIVAGVHANSGRKSAAKRDLLLGVEQRYFDAIDLRRVVPNNCVAHVDCTPVVGVLLGIADPVAGERGIEHFANQWMMTRLRTCDST